MFKPGEAAFELLHGTDYISNCSAHPGEANASNAAMGSASLMALAEILATYDFSYHHRVMDVGGETGSTAAGDSREPSMEPVCAFRNEGHSPAIGCVPSVRCSPH